ncbi:MAG: hypothetical protein ACU84Q_10705 [Gammaproteobacteria bacterium]
MNALQLSVNFSPASGTLLERVPTVDEGGKPLGDLLVILPKLRDKPAHQIGTAVDGIARALAQFSNTIVFAELNIQRNSLWVSMRPHPGIRASIAHAIRFEVPDAKLVAHL